MPKELSHFDEQGASRMVDVGDKPITQRTARASGLVRMSAETLALIRDKKLAKGDVLEVARLAGIQAAKRTSDLIPLCHPLPLDAVKVDFTFPDDTEARREPRPPDSAPSPYHLPMGEGLIRIEAQVDCTGKTGVEMEALTAVSVAALTIYDMCKSAERGITIEQIRLEEKSGGRSGTWKAGEPKAEGGRRKAE
jgi:cyclic pyranopterin monophosphate synthase